MTCSTEDLETVEGIWGNIGDASCISCPFGVIWWTAYGSRADGRAQETLQ